jgi:hypothetical protein
MCTVTWDTNKELSIKQHSKSDIDSKHLKDQQDIADAFDNCFSSIIDKICTNNVANKINDEMLPTFHYLEQIYLLPSSYLVLKRFQPNKLNLYFNQTTYIYISIAKNKKFSWVWWDFYSIITN